MTGEQIYIFGVLAGALALFAWGRWRADIVALMALLAVVLGGLIEPAQAFSGFAHPAVITVAAVLILSHAMRASGVVELLAAPIEPLAKSTFTHIVALTLVCAVCSAFINNVGALALLMPVALATARAHGRSPALVLMPLAFGSILGGLMTLIGTPPNIIIAAFRAETSGEAFLMFDYAPVGAPLALAGVVFVALVGWRLIPTEGRRPATAETDFDIGDYIFEVQVAEDSPLVGEAIRELERAAEYDLAVAALVRNGNRRLAPSRGAILRAEDILLVRGPVLDFQDLLKKQGLALLEHGKVEPESLRSRNVELIEAVVPPGSLLDGRTPLTLLRRFGGDLKLLGIARQGQPVLSRLGHATFRGGDVLLLQGDAQYVSEMISTLGCLPLAARGLSRRLPGGALITIAVFAAALIAAALGYMPPAITFTAAIVVLVVAGQIRPREMYDAVDWPVIVLLGAMMPVGLALRATGSDALIAETITGLAAGTGPVLLLALVLIVTMTLSDVINNAATTVIMAPIAIGVAQTLGVSTDTFLMAVALGASCAFLTPIGHQSNLIVMGPGGYKFSDYWRMGLPVEIIIVLLGLPLLLWAWPLNG